MHDGFLLPGLGPQSAACLPLRSHVVTCYCSLLRPLECMDMRRNDVVAALKQAEPALRARGVAALYLFGSHARDQARPDSDVDVFIDKDKTRKFGFDEFMDVYFLLQERLGTGVDYGTREGLHPVLRPEIEREAIRIF
jgi:predicted nucleotidyltransferase